MQQQELINMETAVAAMSVVIRMNISVMLGMSVDLAIKKTVWVT